MLRVVIEASAATYLTRKHVLFGVSTFSDLKVVPVWRLLEK